MGEVLDGIFSFFNVQCGGYTTEIYGAPVAAAFTTYGTGAELIGGGGVGLEGEFDEAALATSFDCPVVVLINLGQILYQGRSYIGILGISIGFELIGFN